MSQYTAPDKTTGGNWTPAEHNELKEAVNSKFDADKVKQNIDTPETDEVPSTYALNAVKEALKKWVVLEAAVDVTDVTTITDGSVIAGFSTHALTVDGTPMLGMLIAQKPATGSGNTYFFVHETGGLWTYSAYYDDWIEHPDVGKVQTLISDAIKGSGTPVVTVTGTGLTPTLNTGSNDRRGSITVANDGNASGDGLDFIVTLNIETGLTNAFVQLTNLKGVGVTLDSVGSDTVKFKMPAISSGVPITFYYRIEGA